jgi:NAD(P)-dependent dehydrogenase (short-subunit alcohol dehydrogenase family)
MHRDLDEEDQGTLPRSDEKPLVYVPKVRFERQDCDRDWVCLLHCESRNLQSNSDTNQCSGARGLGLSMAQALCESGIKAVAIFDIQPTLGESMAKSLNASTDIPVRYYNVDVTDENNVENAVRQVVQHFGCIDILINSAGVAFSNIPAESHKLDVFQRTININLVGSFCIARAVAKHMIAATPKTNSSSKLHIPDRSIIFIASMSGSIVNYPQPQCAYNASKAGVIQLSKCLAAEWAKYGIRVNTVSPGYMDTVLNKTPALNSQKVIWKERTPLGRLGEVEELGNVVVWLAGEGSKFCTGSDVKVDGGYSVY